MVHSSFTIYSILFVISIIGGITGIIFLIVGLINDKRKMWLPGIFITGLAIILALVVIVHSVRSAVKFAGHKVTESFDYVDAAVDEISEDYSMESYAYFLNKGYAYPSSKYFYVCDNYTQTFIYLKKEITNKLQIEDYNKLASENNSLNIRITFEAKENVNNQFSLVVFDEQQKDIGSQVFKIDAKKGESIMRDFVFDDIQEICNAKYFAISFQ